MKMLLVMVDRNNIAFAKDFDLEETGGWVPVNFSNVAQSENFKPYSIYSVEISVPNGALWTYPPKDMEVTKQTADNFAACMAFVWPEEGGFSNDPADHGGPTNLGVTLADLERAGLPATVEELKALTKDKAATEIYRPFYWNALHCDELPAGVDLEVFDLGINAGIKEAARLLQRDVGTVQDGVIGPKTIAAAHAKPALDIINTFNTERVTFYKSLKQFDRFGRDWLKRSADCFALAQKMAKS